MPSSTPKQAKTMQAAAHSPAFAAQVGIPVKVAKDFNNADLKRKAGSLAGALRAPKGQLSGGGQPT